jgi:Flp pilus assembly protein TadD
MAAEPTGVAYSSHVTEEATLFRGDSVQDTLTASFARLAEYYNKQSMTADVAYWLIGGYVATGQTENAGAYLNEALAMYPRDLRLRMLAGILAYKQSDLDGAEHSFRSVVDADLNDGVAHFNLGVVLMQQGRTEEAMPVFDRAADLLRGTPLAGRIPAASTRE